MKIIITGATGSLGGAMVRYFSRKGYTVIAYGHAQTPPNALKKYAEYHFADITKPFEFPDADVVIHTAALSDDKATDKQLYTPNVIGTQNVLNAAKNCKTFIHVSSSSVYIPSKHPLKEEDAGSTKDMKLSAYGNSKFLAEDIVRKFAKNESVFILRPRNLYGVGDKMIFPRMLKLVKNETIHAPGSLPAVASMTHYDNFGHAAELCFLSEKKSIQTYNVADADALPLLQVIVLLTDMLYGKALPVKSMPVSILKILAFFRIGGVTPLLVRAITNDMILDCSKIKSELNYTPTMTYEKSLPEIQAWVKNIGGVDRLKAAEKILAWTL